MSRKSGNLLKKIGGMLPVRADSEQDDYFVVRSFKSGFFIAENDGTVKTEKDFAK